MTRIDVTEMGDLEFRVDVAEGDQARTTHTVTVPQDLLDDLALASDEADRLVRESFGFLLEREKPTQILPEFRLDEIGRYFPEYRTEIADRMAA